MRNHLGSREQHFLVVTWDQRGTGKSYDHTPNAEGVGGFSANIRADEHTRR